jgi:hypothetical protein
MKHCQLEKSLDQSGQAIVIKVTVGQATARQVTVGEVSA